MTTFVSVAVLLSLLVPISFYVSIEMVKLIIQVSITADAARLAAAMSYACLQAFIHLC